MILTAAHNGANMVLQTDVHARRVDRKGQQMTIEELKARKRALGYTNKMVSDLSGVPLGTVNKIFSGSTSAPRYDTLRAIADVLRAREYQKEGSRFVYSYPEAVGSTARVEESVLATFYNVGRKPGEYTVEDWYALPDDHRMELIEGHFYDLAEPLLTHQNVVLSLSLLFSECAEAHPEKNCWVFVSPVGVRLVPDEKTMVEPDVVVFCGLEYVQDIKCITGPPDLLVEVLSPSNRDHDMVFKQMIYRKYGVKEYWIVDPDKEEVLVYKFFEADLPRSYTFKDNVPVGISGGECSIDLTRAAQSLHRLKDMVK